MKSIAHRHTFTFAGCIHNVYHCAAGEGLPKHDHTYAHATICHAGEIIVRKEGKTVTLTPDSGAVVLVADEWHEIEAVADGTVFENIFHVQL